MVKPELGTKRTCPNCAARFYDLLKDPITCPKCSTSFEALLILPSKTEIPGLGAQNAPKPRDVEGGDDHDSGEVELISLEDAEAEEKGDDETAGIEDVDLGDDDGGPDDEDDTFLVEEEDEGNMDDLVEGGGKDDDEEQ